MTLAWTTRPIEGGTVYTAREIRNGAALTHTVEPGAERPDGRRAFCIRTMVLWPAGSNRHHSDLRCYAVTDPGQDVLEAAEVVARAWAV